MTVCVDESMVCFLMISQQRLRCWLPPCHVDGGGRRSFKYIRSQVYCSLASIVHERRLVQSSNKEDKKSYGLISREQ